MSRENQIQLVRQWKQTQYRETGEQLWQIILSRIERNLRISALMLGLSHVFLDILQDTFIDFTEKVLSGDFKPEGNASPCTFVHRMAVNKMLSEVRRRSCESKVLKKNVHDRLKNDGDDPAELAEKHDNVSLCIKTLEVLQEPLKTVFCLRVGIRICKGTVTDDIEMNNTEIGQLYGKSRGWASEQYTKSINILIKKLIEKTRGSDF